MTENLEERQPSFSFSREHHELLIGLKTTVEGLLASPSTNVWNTYGGLGRISQCIEKILYHGLKCTQGDFGSQLDYWPFIRELKRVNPVLGPMIERINRTGEQSEDEKKGQIWLRESLNSHNVTEQLKMLVRQPQLLDEYYYSYSYLCKPDYFQAMLTCLWAVEHNKVALLAEIDASLINRKDATLHKRHSMPNTDVASDPPLKIEIPRKSGLFARAPPLISPTNGDSISTSDEHAVPSMMHSSSPDESRNRAREALRNVFKKSEGVSPTDVPEEFSFYDNMISDPLLNVDFTSFERMQSTCTSPTQWHSTSELESTANDSSNVITGISTNISRSQSEMCVPALKSDANFRGSSTNKLFEKTAGISKGGVKFLSSENIDSSKSSVVKGHKRSRSDMSGLNIDKIIPIHQSSTLPTLKKSPDDECDTAALSTRLSSTIPVVKHEEKSSPEPLHSPYGREGYFPPPTKGQSLIDYLSSQDFHTCANLEKENAHFSISEALIAAIETMKWNHVISPHISDNEGDSDEEIKQLKQRIRIRRRERLKEQARAFPVLSDGRTDTTTASYSTSPLSSSPQSTQSTASSGGSQEIDDQELELTEEENKSNLQKLKSSGMSLSLASLYSDADIQKNISNLERENSLMENSSPQFSAESVAMSLLKKFSEKRLPKASDLQWLVSEQDAPQQLLPLPNSYPISPDDGEHADLLISGLRTRMRGNLEWAPPRPQIIFIVHPTPRRNVIIAKQNYRCAGCGMKVEAGYLKRYRYCEYMGKYFCQCCHNSVLSYIPGRILQKWDFTKYNISDFAKDLLIKIQNDPLFNISDINPLLYRKVKSLQTIKDYRLQLPHIKSFLTICKKCEGLLGDLKKLSSHLVEETHTYSLNDLINVKNGQLLALLKNVVLNSIHHILGCQFCLGLGFICECCGNGKDIIFPFQLYKVQQCPDCKSCFHRQCFIPGKCPKCARIELRRQIQPVNTSDVEEESEENDNG